MSIIFEPARNVQSRYQFPTPKRALSEDLSFYFPGDLCLRIIQYFIGSGFQRSSEDIGSLYLVSRNWTALLSSLEYTEPIKTMLIGLIAFNKLKWEEYIGDVGKEPSLPANMYQILQSQCPIWPGKKVEQTHLLTLIPKTVNGKPLTLKLMDSLVQKPTKGNKTNFKISSFYGHDKTTVKKSHWVLMTKDVIPDSRKKSYSDQKQLAQTCNKHGIEYEVPKLLDVAVNVFMEYVQTGERLLSDKPWTFTRCREQESSGNYQMIVGGFSLSGLGVDADDYGYDRYYGYYCIGLCVSRKFR